MSQRLVFIPDIGEVILARRRGNRNLRLSINAEGKIRVGMPRWAPYAAAITFAKSHKDWIVAHQLKNSRPVLRNNQRIGKAHTLIFKSSDAPLTSRISQTLIIVSGPYDFDDARSQAKARQACEKALSQEAHALLPFKLKELSQKSNLAYKGYRIRKLTSRWGSCSSHKIITLSYFLMQLPWELIDYILLHELVHTKHMNHSRDFWQLLEEFSPNAKQKQKIIREHKPRVEPWDL